MIKGGQIYQHKTPWGVRTIVLTGQHAGKIACLYCITNEGRASSIWEYQLANYDLIGEFPNFMDAVNSDLFRNRVIEGL